MTKTEVCPCGRIARWPIKERQTMKPELIVKQKFYVDSTGDVEYAVPLVLLLGNREGLRELGEWLLRVAERGPKTGGIDTDPDDHQHLSSESAPFNPALSDELEFRVGILSEATRDATLKRYDIHESTR